jgi:hypothetical protein
MLNNAPRTGSDDIRILLPQISNLLHKILPVIDEAANLCNVSVDERNSHGYYSRQSNQSNTTSSNLVSPNMPWPNESSYYERENVSTDLSEAEQQLNLVSSELSPLFDRLGRVMTDLSPHLREIHNRNTPSPLPQTFPDHTFSSLLRTRAPSPPPENRFRELISTSRANGSAGRTGSFPGNHLDIHIAILSPSHHVNHSENTISQTVASLALQLQNRLGSQQDLAPDTRAQDTNDDSNDSQSGLLLPAFNEDIPDLQEENTTDTDIESNNEIKSNNETNDEDNEKDNDSYSYKDNYNENDDDNDNDNDDDKDNDNDNDNKKVNNNSNDNEKHNDNIKCSAKDESIPGQETESSAKDESRSRPLSFLERLRQPLFRR